jgi:anthranilate synthase component 2
VKLLLLDNYDSFTFNLLHYLEQHDDVSVDVFRNDKINLSEVEKYDAVVLSPGPGLPNDAGILLPLIKKYASTKNIFGVCLGMQAIVEAFGGTLKNLENVQHGIKRKTIIIDKTNFLYLKMPDTFLCGRYHSWVADERTIPACLKVTAVDEANNIMSVQHDTYNICGVQFHPESILTDNGLQIITNWISNIVKVS